MPPRWSEAPRDRPDVRMHLTRSCKNADQSGKPRQETGRVVMKQSIICRPRWIEDRQREKSRCHGPTVHKSAVWLGTRRVSAVRIANGAYQGCLPRILRPSWDFAIAKPYHHAATRVWLHRLASQRPPAAVAEWVMAILVQLEWRSQVSRCQR